MSPTIVIADDHPLMLQGNKKFLVDSGFSVIDTASDGIEAYNKVLKLQPDLAILDYVMPKLNGLEVAKALKAKHVETKIIILTLYKDEAIFAEVGHAIDGYVLKDDALNKFENCINQVVNQKVFLSAKLLRQNIFNTSSNALDVLTVTEIKILKYLVVDMTSTQIAEELFISTRTVQKHRSNAIRKLGLDSKAHSLLIWVKNNPNILQIN